MLKADQVPACQLYMLDQEQALSTLPGLPECICLVQRHVPTLKATTLNAAWWEDKTTLYITTSVQKQFQVQRLVPWHTSRSRVAAAGTIEFDAHATTSFSYSVGWCEEGWGQAMAELSTNHWLIFLFFVANNDDPLLMTQTHSP